MTFEDETLRYNTLKLAISAVAEMAAPCYSPKDFVEIATVFENYILGRNSLQSESDKVD